MNVENLTNDELRRKLINAGRKAVAELIKVAEDNILKKIKSKSSKSSKDKDELFEDDGYSLSSDKLKNAAAAKKMAIFDGFDILTKIDAEEASLLKDGDKDKDLNKTTGFAEQHSNSPS